MTSELRLVVMAVALVVTVAGQWPFTIEEHLHCEIVVKPALYRVIEGRNLRLSCDVRCVGGNVYDLHTQWYGIDDLPVMQSTEGRYSLMRYGKRQINLRIETVTVLDSGVYTCAGFVDGEWQTDSTHVIVEKRPDFIPYVITTRPTTTTTTSTTTTTTTVEPETTSTSPTTTTSITTTMAVTTTKRIPATKMKTTVSEPTSTSSTTSNVNADTQPPTTTTTSAATELSTSEQKHDPVVTKLLVSGLFSSAIRELTTLYPTSKNILITKLTSRLKTTTSPTISSIKLTSMFLSRLKSTLSSSRSTRKSVTSTSTFLTSPPMSVLPIRQDIATSTSNVMTPSTYDYTNVAKTNATQIQDKTESKQLQNINNVTEKSQTRKRLSGYSNNLTSKTRINPIFTSLTTQSTKTLNITPSYKHSVQPYATENINKNGNGATLEQVPTDNRIHQTYRALTTMPKTTDDFVHEPYTIYKANTSKLIHNHTTPSATKETYNTTVLSTPTSPISDTTKQYTEINTKNSDTVSREPAIIVPHRAKMVKIPPDTKQSINSETLRPGSINTTRVSAYQSRDSDSSEADLGSREIGEERNNGTMSDGGGSNDYGINNTANKIESVLGKDTFILAEVDESVSSVTVSTLSSFSDVFGDNNATSILSNETSKKNVKNKDPKLQITPPTATYYDEEDSSRETTKPNFETDTSVQSRTISIDKTAETLKPPDIHNKTEEIEHHKQYTHKHSIFTRLIATVSQNIRTDKTNIIPGNSYKIPTYSPGIKRNTSNMLLSTLFTRNKTDTSNNKSPTTTTTTTTTTLSPPEKSLNTTLPRGTPSPQTQTSVDITTKSREYSHKYLHEGSRSRINSERVKTTGISTNISPVISKITSVKPGQKLLPTHTQTSPDDVRSSVDIIDTSASTLSTLLEKSSKTNQNTKENPQISTRKVDDFTQIPSGDRKSTFLSSNGPNSELIDRRPYIALPDSENPFHGITRNQTRLFPLRDSSIDDVTSADGRAN